METAVVKKKKEHNHFKYHFRLFNTSIKIVASNTLLFFFFTVAVLLSWACDRRSLRSREKDATLSFSVSKRKVHLSKCITNLT